MNIIEDIRSEIRAAQKEPSSRDLTHIGPAVPFDRARPWADISSSGKDCHRLVLDQSPESFCAFSG